MDKLIKVILEDRYHPCDCEATRILTNAPMSFIKKCEEKANVDIKKLSEKLGSDVTWDDVPYYGEEEFIKDLEDNKYLIFKVTTEIGIKID